MIKICGIRDAAMARMAALAGAHLIGIVFHASSKRHVPVDQALAISKATKEAGASPVAVFVNQTDIEMRKICEAADIQIVQLHGAEARLHHHLLPQEYQRIYALAVEENGELALGEGFQYLKPTRDTLLVDNASPGQGQLINLKGISRPFQFPWLLAGGLNPSNVAGLVHKFHPNGVDVSTGVEVFPGQKDIFLVQQFITALRTNI